MLVNINSKVHVKKSEVRVTMNVTVPGKTLVIRVHLNPYLKIQGIGKLSNFKTK